MEKLLTSGLLDDDDELASWADRAAEAGSAVGRLHATVLAYRHFEVQSEEVHAAEVRHEDVGSVARYLHVLCAAGKDDLAQQQWHAAYLSAVARSDESAFAPLIWLLTTLGGSPQARRRWVQRWSRLMENGALQLCHPGRVLWCDVVGISDTDVRVTWSSVEGVIPGAELSWGTAVPADFHVGQRLPTEILHVDLDEGTLLLSAKAVQAPPWLEFARDTMIGGIVPAQVLTASEQGVLMRLGDGVQGLVPAEETSPNQVWTTGTTLLVMLIDCDLDVPSFRLSLREANALGLAEDAEFDPARFGMAASYDAGGEYVFPSGFDAASGEWRPDAAEEQQEWEAQYRRAQERWLSLKEQARSWAQVD